MLDTPFADDPAYIAVAIKVLTFSVLFRTFCFLQLYCPNGISIIGNSGCFSRGKPAATQFHYPTCGACWVFQCFHNPPNSDMDYRIVNMPTDVKACDCTQGCMDTIKEFALKVDSWRKIPCRTGELNLPQQCASPTLYKLSYIPSQCPQQREMKFLRN